MMLRLILVGLVTSMGVQLPSSRDMSCWAESGRAWASARICDVTNFGVAVVPAAAPVAVVESADADRAFQAVAAEMVADLAADRLTAGAEPAADTAEICLVTTDAAAAGAGDEAGDELVAVGLPTGEELAAVAPADPVVAADAGATIEEATPALAAEVEDDSPSRADRLAEAVRLTREAAQAWADLAQEPAAETSCGR